MEWSGLTRNARRKGEETMKTAKQLETMFGLTPESALWLRDALKRPASIEALREADKMLETHGVESFRYRTRGGDTVLVEYCNTGDPYGATVMVETRRSSWGAVSRRWKLGTWGDIAGRVPESRMLSWGDGPFSAEGV